MAEIAINGEQARSRLEFLDRLELLCKGKDTDKILIHSSLEKNLWIFGIQYSIFSSNKTLKRQIEDYLGKKYTGKREKKRPDLMLSVNHANEYLLIKFKRPSHSLKHIDYQQVTGYRNDLYLSEIQKFRNSEIRVLLIGGKRSRDLPPSINKEPNTSIMIFDEIISNSRNQVNWLLIELDSDVHA